MANKPTTITYDGKVIASFSAGQKATLTTKGDELEHNIIVVAGSGSGAPKLQEKTATENGVVVPDRGYDGLSKVTVDVQNSGGGGITTSAKSQKSEMRYVSSQMGAITTTATASVA